MHKKAFTLVEMLIVIVIIWILAAALIPRIQLSQGRTRDVARKADMQTIISALEIYMMDMASYPKRWTYVYNQNGYITSNGLAWPWLTWILPYVSQIPKDPINTRNQFPRATQIQSYVYAYGNVFNPENTQCSTCPKVRTYDLIMNLENPKDSERCELKQYKYYNNWWNRCWPYPKTLRDYSPNVKNVP